MRLRPATTPARMGRLASAADSTTMRPVGASFGGFFDGGQLSGRVALADSHAEGDVETLLIRSDKLRALPVAEADLGEWSMWPAV